MNRVLLSLFVDSPGVNNLSINASRIYSIAKQITHNNTRILDKYAII